MNEPIHTHQRLDPQATKYRWVGFLIAALIVGGIIYLRFRMWPSVDDEDLTAAYNHTCEVLYEDADVQPLFDETKKMLRRAGTNVHIHFLYEFVRRMHGEPPINDQFEPVERPVRSAIKAQDFEHARSLIQEAIIHDETLKPSRGKLWLDIIDALSIRSKHGCQLQSEEHAR